MSLFRFNTARRTDKKTSKVAILPVRRDLRFDLPAERISDWHVAAGRNFTAFLNTFSLVLPVGERFFIDSVRQYRDRVTDPELKQAVTAFIGQEAMHGREHEDYNRALFAVSKVAPKFERLIGNILKFSSTRGFKALNLSSTIALEHLTALFADRVLNDPLMTEAAEARFAAVWRWHALEETEHKGVAYDVWNAALGRGPGAYLLRSGGMLYTMALFWGLVIPAYLLVLREQGVLTDTAEWRKFYRYAFGEVGFLRKLALPWLDYFRPDFHPWDHGDREVIAQIDAFAAPYRTPLRAAA